MEKSFEIGNVYFIKDGKIANRKLHTTKGEIIKEAKNLPYSGIIPILALEEQKQVKNMLPRNPYLKVYKDFLKNNYAIIRVDYNFNINMDRNHEIKKIDYADKKVYTFLPPNIDKKSIHDSISKIAQYNVSQNAGFPYEIKDATIGGIWYGIPVNLENDVSKLHYNLFGTENYVPSETVKNISAKILEKQ